MCLLFVTDLYKTFLPLISLGTILKLFFSQLKIKEQSVFCLIFISDVEVQIHHFVAFPWYLIDTRVFPVGGAQDRSKLVQVAN
jgi:hypothetical protein